MGIPYLFASLIKSHPGIVQSVRRTLEVDVLGIDFNCLIHRYVQDADPIKSVIDALEYITQHICKPKQLFIAIDGLVPYGKIVQQRYRRMNGTGEVDTTVFDRNQISPDTPYMRDLYEGLKARFPLAHISSTQEPGEGEHKLFNSIKQLSEDQRRSVCIYGLDADLILISLQHHKLSFAHSFYLLRESSEFNDPKLAKAEFATVCIWKLLGQLPMDIYQYVALSILCFGNDFMPSLAMFSLREGGYDRALQIYDQCGKPDLLTNEGRRHFLSHAKTSELELLRERILLRKRPEERAILGKDTSLLSKKFGLHYLDGVQDMKPVVEAFLKTFEWTLYYFQNGEPLNWDWVYPYPEAPLITDIMKYSINPILKKSKCKYTVRHQLVFILPEYALKKTRRRVVYPDELYNETRNLWMKKHEWEGKPRISLPWNPNYELTHVQPI